MKLLLLFSPLADPTLPPLGVSTLAGYVNAQSSHTAKYHDLNIDFWQELLSARNVSEVLEHLDVSQQHHLPDTILKLPQLVEAAKHTFSNKEHFFNFNLYRQATNTVNLVISLINQTYEHFKVSDELNGLDWKGAPPLKAKDFSRQIDYFEQLSFNPIKKILDKLLDDVIKTEKPDVIGLSQIYDGQSLLTRYLTRKVKTTFPTIKTVVGGTSLAEHSWRLKIINEEAFQYIFEGADYLVVGEGEPTIVRLLNSLETSEEKNEIPNLVYFDRGKKEPVITKRAAAPNLNELPLPDYNLNDLDKYFSPVPVLSVAPTRGCYWDRCTFCSYGLRIGERITAPWREIQPENLAHQLKFFMKKYGSRHFIFAVDVLSAKSTEAYSKTFSQENLGLYWQAETRPDRNLLIEGRLATLYEGGLRHLSLGMESASQKILDDMDKGTQVTNFDMLLRSLDQHNIAADLMLFNDFPTETIEDRLESVRFFLGRKELLHRPVRFGKFQLLYGSLIQRNPEKFGVDILPELEDEILRRDIIPYETKESLLDTDNETKLQAQLRDAINQLCGDTHLGQRPWVGSTGSAHTFLYFAELGMQSVKEYNKFIHNNRQNLIEKYNLKLLEQNSEFILGKREKYADHH